MDAQVEIVSGVSRISFLRDGQQAFSNREYAWKNVPSDLPFARVTMVKGGGQAPVVVNVTRAGWLTIAIRHEEGKFPDCIIRNGWERTKHQFAYTAHGSSKMYVFRKNVQRGTLTIPRLTWAGPVVLLKEAENVSASADTKSEWRPLFKGRDFSGWRRDKKLWSISDGVVIGKRGSKASESPTHLVSEAVHHDFEARFKIKLIGEAADSGFMFRSILVDEESLIVSGPQYNILRGDWASLRIQGAKKFGLKGGPLKDADESVVRSLVLPNDFNSVHVRCKGKLVTVSLNGTEIIDGEFETIPRAGLLAWQLWMEPNFEVHIKEAYIKEVNADMGVTELLSNNSG